MAEMVASSAYGPMVLVAVEQTLPADQRIIDDAFAYQMLPMYMQWMVKLCQLRFIRQMLFNAMDSSMLGMRAGFPSRKRYIDEKINTMPLETFDSLVILGAGIDTLAYRNPRLSAIQVYEVDLPENIAYKEKKLKQIFGAVPSHIKLIPIHFEQQKLDEVLIQEGYSFDDKSIFIWEAVTQYLSESAVRDVFGVLSDAYAGSRLIFTYVLKDFITGENTYGLDSLYKRFRVNDKLWLFGLHPTEVSDFIAGDGWRELEQAGSEEFIAQFLKPIGRPESISEIERMVYAEKI